MRQRAPRPTARRLGLLLLLSLTAGGIAFLGMRRVDAERQATRDAEIRAELEAMRAADQAVRQLFLGKVEDAVARTRQRVLEIDQERTRLDVEHVAALSAILDELGEWPGPPRFDARDAQSACVIAVHATHDRDFMRRARDLMGAKVEGRRTDLECWAQVTDRVLIQTGRPQRFGTQLRGEVLGGVFHWGVAPVDAPEELLARRAEVGLGDYREYLERQRADYRIPKDTPAFPDEPRIPGL